MIIENLRVSNFRNFSKADLHFTGNSVLLEGANGQGKTSLLEAIFYLANLRSFRTSRTIELRKIGSSGFDLFSDYFHSNGWKSVLEIHFGQTRSLLVDKSPVVRASDFTGKIKTVAFLPDDPLIISGSSVLRRRFFDMFISMMNRSYFILLQNYVQALSSRNYLLKSKKSNPDILDSYSAVLASAGAAIVKIRLQYTAVISNLMSELFQELYPEIKNFELKMRYLPETEEQNAYLNKMNKELSKDLNKGFTSFGPHLDDFEFVFDHKSMRFFGSRGQCRMASLILKLAELEAVRKEQGALQNTVVLVDDATVDLDSKARTSLHTKIQEAGQVFYAFTEVPKEYCSDCTDRFKIFNGMILA